MRAKQHIENKGPQHVLFSSIFFLHLVTRFPLSVFSLFHRQSVLPCLTHTRIHPSLPPPLFSTLLPYDCGGGPSPPLAPPPAGFAGTDCEGGMPCGTPPPIPWGGGSCCCGGNIPPPPPAPPPIPPDGPPCMCIGGGIIILSPDPGGPPGGCMPGRITPD